MVQSMDRGNYKLESLNLFSSTLQIFFYFMYFSQSMAEAHYKYLRIKYKITNYVCFLQTYGATRHDNLIDNKQNKFRIIFIQKKLILPCAFDDRARNLEKLFRLLI